MLNIFQSVKLSCGFFSSEWVDAAQMKYNLSSPTPGKCQVLNISVIHRLKQTVMNGCRVQLCVVMRINLQSSDPSVCSDILSLDGVFMPQIRPRRHG